MKPKLGRPRLFLARGNQLTASWVMNSSGNHYVNVLHNMILAGYITQALSTLIILSGPVFATQVLLMRGYHWHCIRRLYINIWLLSRTMECQHAEHRGYNSTSVHFTSVTCTTLTREWLWFFCDVTIAQQLWILMVRDNSAESSAVFCLSLMVQATTIAKGQQCPLSVWNHVILRKIMSQ